MAEPAGAPGPVLRAFAPEMLEQVLALNEAAVPAVNSVSATLLNSLGTQSECFLTAELHGEIAGFLLLLGRGADYASPNYRWFAGRYRDFLYVDRVVVAARARRRGVGHAFYREAGRRARARRLPLTCEVNVEPPNPGSLAFHAALGFREVGRQSTERGTKTVALLAREPA